MGKWKTILKETIFAILVVGLCSLIIAVGKGYHPSLFGYQVLRVVTASMVPTLEENTLILIKKVPQEEIQVGDIVTFVSDDPALLGFYNTHRVYQIEEYPEAIGGIRYITKGDNNDYPDAYPVYYEDIAGDLVCVLPLGNKIGGWIAGMADNKRYFFIVMLPLLICLISYIWQIFHILFIEKNEEGETDESETAQIQHKSDKKTS